MALADSVCIGPGESSTCCEGLRDMWRGAHTVFLLDVSHSREGQWGSQRYEAPQPSCGLHSALEPAQWFRGQEGLVLGLCSASLTYGLGPRWGWGLLAGPNPQGRWSWTGQRSPHLPPSPRAGGERDSLSCPVWPAECGNPRKC